MEREIAQWVHPMKDRSDDPSHHGRTLLPQSYILLFLEKERDVALWVEINHNTFAEFDKSFWKRKEGRKCFI